MACGSKTHVPSRSDADAWHTLALLAEKISLGQSRAWHELKKQADRGVSLVVFGQAGEFNVCTNLRRTAIHCAESTAPETYYNDLHRLAGEVKRRYEQFEAVRKAGG